MGFKSRLVLLVSIPVLGLLLISGLELQSRWAQYQQMATFKVLNPLILEGSRMIHELQKERGATAGFLGSQGKEFEAVLKKQRGDTDLVIKSFESELASSAEGTMGAFKQALAKNWENHAGAIEKIRVAVEQLNIPPAEALSGYTRAITMVMDGTVEGLHFSNNNEITELLAGIHYFMQGKERAGLERALLSTVFNEGSFKKHPESYSRLVRLVAQQEAFFSAYAVLLHGEEREAFDRAMQAPAVRAAEELRAVALSGEHADTLGVKAEAWYSAQTAKIDQLKAYEDTLAQALAHTTREEQQKLFEAILILVGGTGVILLITGILGSYLLHNAIKYLSMTISGAVSGLTESSAHLVSLSGAIAASSQTLAASTSQQAASVEEITATLTTISSMTRENATHAEDAASLSTKAREHSQRGEVSMKRMREAMGYIKSSTDETAKIIKTIDEIAFQTNLLALNAAVEAARAGESGRGFAVVAEEVRNLALRSAEAARSTTTLIEDSLNRAETGVTMAGEMDHSLASIKSTINQLDDVLGLVTRATQEQTQGIQQINQAMTQMETLTQDNAASSEENSAASEELKSEAKIMDSFMHQLLSLLR
ncbi:MAG: methyl-accepting chemotaxis protein [Deltaproteobacteria bacterium]|nr:methyl-accepting chemotaxis protein [Deltaproteobacteria bacterium]